MRILELFIVAARINELFTVEVTAMTGIQPLKSALRILA
jgi:hypothetical protein